MNNNKKRIEYIDFFKGIGIILMIMGHVGFGSGFDYFIHSFHMPMFFLISGYLFNGSGSFKKFIKKKSKQLLIPYIIFGLISFLIFAYLNFNYNEAILSKLYALLFINTNNMPITGALWFLTALFFAQMIYYFITRIKFPILRFIVVVLITILGVIIPTYFRLPYGIDISMACIGFMYAGAIIKKYQKNIFNLNFIYIVLFTCLTLYLIFINGYVNLRLGNYAIVPLTYFNAIVSSIIILYISRFICEEKIFDISFFNKIKNLLISIGYDSITYLVLNELIILFITKILNIFNFPSIISSFLCLIFTLIILYIINKILNFKYFKFCIGKHNNN